jgi:hypothetical protein
VRPRSQGYTQSGGARGEGAAAEVVEDGSSGPFAFETSRLKVDHSRKEASMPHINVGDPPEGILSSCIPKT